MTPSIAYSSFFWKALFFLFLRYICTRLAWVSFKTFCSKRKPETRTFRTALQLPSCSTWFAKAGDWKIGLSPSQIEYTRKVNGSSWQQNRYFWQPWAGRPAKIRCLIGFPILSKRACCHTYTAQMTSISGQPIDHDPFVPSAKQLEHILVEEGEANWNLRPCQFWQLAWILI